jgi:hypothetical protein
MLQLPHKYENVNMKVGVELDAILYVSYQAPGRVNYKLVNSLSLPIREFFLTLQKVYKNENLQKC